MNKISPRTLAQHDPASREAFVGLWTLGLWGLAALYLLATFNVR
ncbi:MAG TPA: hypothetical protein VG986_10260 [Pseudolabrys sp.]|nr:hypothetical protein [Pseudolabrys sp.]